MIEKLKNNYDYLIRKKIEKQKKLKLKKFARASEVSA